MSGVTTSWKDAAKVDEYVSRVGRLAARRAGEAELLANLPAPLTRVLDLGCGNGSLIDLVLGATPGVAEAVGLDNSAPMLELARERFDADARVRIEEHDLNDPLPAGRGYDAVVSGFAIHHLPHERKRSLFGEVVAALRPGGGFVNLEVVECATPELHEEFNRRIDRPGGDPEDVLAPVGSQLDWMRDAGMVQVDCNWRWRGFALLVGQAPVR
jgi:cyclopropane fatty-acyl-phospholipid synthase-like methyltransferase